MPDSKISGLTAGTPGAADTFPFQRGGTANYSATPGAIGEGAKPYFDTLYLATTAKAIGSEVDTGSNDEKYVTSKAISDSHNVPSVAPGTSGNVLTSNGTAWESAAPASGDGTKTLRATISNPQAVYAQAASLPIMKADAALTITGIYIDTRQTAQEMAGDLKFADDQIIGTLANATVIDVCDTTSGVFSATSGFDDATVPSGKYIYYQFDASPNAAIKDFTLRITYTYD
jgi:hypothetical protein